MEDSKKLYPPLPSNYVTIVDLQKRWMQEKQQQQEKEEQLKRDKYEQNHSVLSNNFVHDDVVKPRSQFRKINRSISDVKPNFKARGSFPGKLYGNKVAEEFRMVKKASNPSGINADTANHVISNENGDCEEKTSRFQKSKCSNSGGNPNFGNRKPFYRNFNGKKRFKEFPVVKNVSNIIAEKSVANVAVATTEFDDQKVKKKKKRNGKKRFKEFPVVKNVSNTTAEKSVANVAVATTEFDDQKVQKEKKRENKKKNQPVVDEETREKEGERLVNDQTVEEKDNQVIIENQTVLEKDNLMIVEEQTVEEKDNQVTMEDQTVEIEQNFKKVSVSRLNGRSAAVMEGKRREYGRYSGGYHRGFGGYRRGYGKGSLVGERGKNVVVDQISGNGRSTPEVEGWRGVHRGYNGVGNRGKNLGRKGDLMWVKKEDVC